MRAILASALVCAVSLGVWSPAGAVTGCETVRGRLEIWNGAPNHCIWIVGTKRILGVSGVGDSVDELPAEIARLWRSAPDGPLGYRILGDFRVCALTRQRAGEMQFVRLESGKRMRLLSPDED